MKAVLCERFAGVKIDYAGENSSFLLNMQQFPRLFVIRPMCLNQLKSQSFESRTPVLK